MLFTGFLRSAALSTLLWGVSACVEDQPAAAGSPDSARQTAGPRLGVYRNPACGCCADWVGHIEAAGFTASIHHPENLHRIKAARGIAPHYGSCHTVFARIATQAEQYQ